MKNLVIVGHGGLAREVAFLVDEINRHKPAWRLRGFIAATREAVGQIAGKYRVIETDDWLAATAEPLAVVLAIGNSRAVEALHRRFRANTHLTFPSLVHPRALGDWGRIRLGDGNIVMGGAAFTTDIVAEACNVFYTGCTVTHDCVFGSYNLVAPGANLSGAVRLGDRVFVGAGAQVLPTLQVTSDVVIGAGAVVTRDLLRPGVYVGTPARRRPAGKGGGS